MRRALIIVLGLGIVLAAGCTSASTSSAGSSPGTKPMPIPMTTPLPQALAGTAWQVVALPRFSLAPGTSRSLASLTLRFEEPARAAGNSGVNRFSAQVNADASQLRFVSPISTRMAGPPELMALESEFLVRLQAVSAWKIDGSRLRLSDAAGLELIVLERARTGG
jgi:heat shock protein HslJ